VIAANRDEFHARPSAPAGWWPDHPDILAGRDLRAGGTWLGISRTGRWAAVTNFRGPQAPRPDAPSRGALVGELLDSRAPAATELTRLGRESPAYNGFNLLFSDGRGLAVHESTTGSGRALSPGIYGLSNHLLDTPWRKLERAKEAFEAAMRQGAETRALLAVLRDEREVGEHELPSTGISLELERRLSRSFIRDPLYGTRCSTLVRIGRDRNVDFDEWSWDAAGEPGPRHRFEFTLSPDSGL
jgi:uncharacterized protein with NRDE domain